MHAQILLILGCILLLGVVTDVIGRRTILPRVTLMIIFGVMIGDEGLGLIPAVFSSHFELIAQTVLVIIGFILGGKLSLNELKNSKKLILFSSIAAAFGTTMIVTFGLFLINVPLNVAILLGCISSATAPAATFDVVDESNIDSPFSQLLLSVVALDDAWGLIIFSLGLAIISTLDGIALETYFIVELIIELGGAAILGVVLGWIAASIPNYLTRTSAIYTATFGLLLVCGGLAIWLGFSYLLASMIMGAIVTNMLERHKHYFHTFENIQWPFLVIFFTLAGATLELNSLKDIGLLGIAYICLRIIGKIFSAYLGCKLGQASDVTARWLGAALLPQAGVAIGMVLVAASQFPEYRQLLLSIVISTTIIFEVIGPVFTRLSIHKASKINT